MTIPYAALFTKFEELADDLIDVVNATSVTLVFKIPTLQSFSPADDDRMKVRDYLGGTVPVSELEGRSLEYGQNVQESTTGVVILARVYWNNKNIDAAAAAINVKDVTDNCKMISYASDDVNLKNCVYATIDNLQCKLLDSPVLHGLGSVKRYSTTYWEVI